MQTASSSELTKKSVQGMLWNYLSHYSGKLLLFISSLILVRMLSRDDYGVAGYAIVTIGFLDFLNDLGIGTALIYHKDEPGAADTAFWLGLVVSGALFSAIWLSAPMIGLFFQDERAVAVIRALAFTLPLTALSNIQESLLRKSLAFRRRFVPDVIRSVSKGGFSIIFALSGMGPWSLVFGQIAGTAISMVIYWLISPWRPSLRFVPAIARPLLSYGLGIVAINALSAVILEVDYLIVGRFMGAESLGVYMLAFRIPELIVLQFCGMVAARVLFPLYAALRTDPEALYRVFFTSTRYIALITVPLGLGMALVADPLVRTAFGDKWVDAIPVMRAISIYALVLSLGYNIGDIYKAQGRTNTLTGLSVVRAIVLVPSLWWAAITFDTIVAIGWTQVVMATFAGLMNLTVAIRIFRFSPLKLAGAFAPALLCGAIMSATVLAVLMITVGMPPFARLALTVSAGALSYIGALWLMQRDLMMTAGSSLRAALVRR